MEQNIIDKIKKCMALASNNPSAEEATSAALMAQKLMAKHGISMVELEEDTSSQESIAESIIWVGQGKAWKFRLSHIIADNFRCKTFSHGSNIVAFYGYQTDAEAAKEVFSSLFKLGDKMAERVAHKAWETTGVRKGVYNSWVLGYMAGIKSKLDEQCKALMIVIAPEVNTQYQEFMQDAKVTKSKFRLENGVDRSIYLQGVIAGKNAVSSRELEEK